MTERKTAALSRDATTLRIGPSGLAWDGTALTLDFDEVTAPLPRRIKGRVRLLPAALTGTDFALDAPARHRWWPIAPLSRVEVELERPSLRWSGAGYLDTNRGAEPLEAGFRDWDWCRAAFAPDEAAIVYDLRRADGTEHTIAIRIAAGSGGRGEVEPVPVPPRHVLPPTGIWRVPRTVGAEPGGNPQVLSTWLDAPFYARSVVTTRLLGRDVTATHESLRLRRFVQPVVQAMLPFRVPRV